MYHGPYYLGTWNPGTLWYLEPWNPCSAVHEIEVLCPHDYVPNTWYLVLILGTWALEGWNSCSPLYEIEVLCPPDWAYSASMLPTMCHHHIIITVRFVLIII